MGEVISYADFYTLRQIKESVKFMTNRDKGTGKFKVAIEGEKNLFKDYLSKLHGEGAAA